MTGSEDGMAQVAQSVEHAAENRGVGGSIPPLGAFSAPSQRLLGVFSYKGGFMGGFAFLRARSSVGRAPDF